MDKIETTQRAHAWRAIFSGLAPMSPVMAVLVVPVLLLVVAALLPLDPVNASDWPRFRGPNGSGISSDTEATPTVWSPTENLRWSVALPGPGVSCPIVVGDRVIVTCYSGYGLDRQEPGDPLALRRHVLCFQRSDGKLLWEKTIHTTALEDEYAGMGVPEHGYASHTPTSDGQRIYAFLGKSGVVAFDLEGTQLWQVSVGTDTDPHAWGSASSPIVYGQDVIVNAGAESRAIVCLEGATGKERWRAKSDGLGNVWGTPILVAVNDQRTDLVLGAPYEIWGINPDTGKVRWYCDAMETDSFNSSVVAGEGKVFAIEGRAGGSVAVKVSGKGNTTESNVVWRGQHNNRFGTPLYHAGRLYYVSNGIAHCVNAESSQSLYQARLPARANQKAVASAEVAGAEAELPNSNRRGAGRGGRGGGRGSDYGSLVMADQKLYYTTQRGDTHVIKPGDQFESLAVNYVTDETENFSATPAISQGQLFLRSDKRLYCVGFSPQ